MDKHARHFAIKEIIGTTAVASQDDLRLALKKRGYKVTQATLSRDMKELGVSWMSTENGGRYVLQPSASEVQILRPLIGPQVLSINANESVIVVRTLPGSANVVGEFLDAQSHPDIIGTIAGDNTLLVIPQSQKKTKALVEFLHKKLIEGE
ncbi:MAG: arginine repressor [Ignavibacteriae bacterium]|nr:arginine repressor [Ignavibacteriota bacterium]